MFAVTFDGKLLVNARALEGEDVKTLAGRKGVFVGVALTKAEQRRLLVDMYDACSATASDISGRRRKKRRREHR